MNLNFKSKLQKILSFSQKENSDASIKYSFKKKFFKYAFKTIQYNGIDGDYAEFGCHGGMTFNLA
jgi:hypothetical protein